MVIMVRKARRILSIASVALASSGAVLYGSHYWDPNDFGMVRIGRAVLATATISCDYLAQLRHIPSGTEEYNEIKSQVHLRSAQRLLDLCCANRGTFIKVGQHIGALEYLLPPEYTSTLQVLHSQAPSTPISDVQRVIHEELGREVSDLFLEFEETPLGAASLAQVHRAVLRDGRTVAVKVQHPKVQTQSARDIRLMEVLLHVVKIIFPQFEFMWLVEEAKKNLPLELDFLKEGRNAEKMAELVRKFPFLRVSHALGKLYSEMIFVHGFVHCDPHPGNVLVCQKPDSRSPEIILLDHGLYQVLTDSFRLDYCGLWQSLISADMKGVRKYSQRLGAGEMYPLFACMLTARSWDSVNRGIDKGPVSREEALEIRSNAASYLPQISQLLASVPRQMLLLLKTNDLLRGIETSLRTKASSSSFLSMSRCCVRALARHNKEKAASLWSYAQISLAESLCLGQLRIYEILLCLQDSFVGRFFHNVLRLVHIYLL
ncbi:aarF domain-containing protein kinase 1 isoform X2 [Bombina bombina]|uniref:aarF domain-containing protein kinase 1 isoform X2 n=1 Tax=Bombina bombina TaxID=8345 RepID=UPI00235ABA88|nr:aarF domain-containing protein kinase 1 isoform X2 [Bombina bombina]